MRKLGLTNNQLKIIAMITMTIDHIGFLLFPGAMLLRCIGRLAFPIYAYMIAEGCMHTRSLPKYLGSMVAMAAVCQIVNLVADRSLLQCILVTFSLSIGLIILFAWAREKKTVGAWVLFGLTVITVFGITEVLPQHQAWLLRRLMPRLLNWLQTGFYVDYGFVGVMLPVCVYAAKGKWTKLAVCAVLLCLLSYCSVWHGQWLCLLALPLLALYNGQRGKWPLKWVFYLYYPAHLAILWLIATIF